MVAGARLLAPDSRAVVAGARLLAPVLDTGMWTGGQTKAISVWEFGMDAAKGWALA